MAPSLARSSSRPKRPNPASDPIRGASNSTDGWVYCSNYMWEPGDQAGSAAAATGTGTGGYAVIGAPTSGTTPRLAWNGTPQNPTVWYDDDANGQQEEVGITNPIDGPSGEADWNQTPGSGAVYVLGF